MALHFHFYALFHLDRIPSVYYPKTDNLLKINLTFHIHF